MVKKGFIRLNLLGPALLEPDINTLTQNECNKYWG